MNKRLHTYTSPLRHIFLQTEKPDIFRVKQTNGAEYSCTQPLLHFTAFLSFFEA